MKKAWLPAMLAIALACNDEADVNPSSGTFIRYFGSENSNTAVTAIEGSNGFVLLANLDVQAADFSVTNQVKLIFTDVNGNISIDEQRFVADSGSYKAASIIPNGSSGYLIIGDWMYQNDGASLTDLLLLFTDVEGKLQETIIISPDSTSSRGTKLLHGKSAVIDADGNVIVLGKLENDGSHDMFMAKYSVSDKKLLWQKAYGDAPSTLVNKLYFNASKSNIVWAGSVEYPTTVTSSFDVRLLKVSEDSEVPLGNPISSPSTDELVNDFCPLPSGWAVTGSTGAADQTGDKDIYFLKVDENGEPVYSRSVEMPGSNDEGNAICADDNGDVVILGTIENGVNQKDFYVVNFDYKGDMQWASRYGGTDDQIGAAVVSTADGFLLFGTTTIGKVKKLLLMKVNKNGKL